MTIVAIETHQPFYRRLRDEGLKITRNHLETVQINVGKYCNQACTHCHVEAGPLRTEIMAWPTMERILALTRQSPTIHMVDITGGAPELNPHFRLLVTELRKMGKEVIDRCNLSVLLEPGQEETAAFLAGNQAHIIASLPCYTRENVDAQRGGGVFEKSIQALHLLNRLGYGLAGSGLLLDLVYNPGGASLPPCQADLEEDYHRELKEQFGIVFNHLLTITNMPIRRFRHYLERTGQAEDYMALLADSFNPIAAEGVMCRSLLSIGWDGLVYDCDFNQMLDIPVGRRRQSIWDVESFDDLTRSPIALGDHCYGCTAGAGSSCKGELTSRPYMSITRKGQYDERKGVLLESAAA